MYWNPKWKFLFAVRCMENELHVLKVLLICVARLLTFGIKIL